MRSVLIHEAGTVTVDTVPDPSLGDARSAVIRVERSAICGSDLHFYDGDLPMYPVAAGHEAVGTVIEVGAEVRSVGVGDRVLVASVAGCGRCAGCGTGNPTACVDGARVFGAGELGGAQSEYLAVPGADFNLLAIPEGIDDEAALLLTDNLSTGWTAAKRAAFAPGADVLVLGLGAVGLCAVRSAYALGAARVFAYDPVVGRRDRGQRFGAIPIDGALDVAAEARDLTDGLGAHAVIDAVANDRSLDTAFAAVRDTGGISVVGVHNLEPYPAPLLMGVFRSINLAMTTAVVHRNWAELVPLVRYGRLATSDIFTHTFDLEDAPAAYGAVAARSEDVVKAQLIVS